MRVRKVGRLWLDEMQNKEKKKNKTYKGSHFKHQIKHLAAALQ